LTKRAVKRQRWHPPLYEKADIRAIQALATWAALAMRPAEPGQEPEPPSPAETKRALDWIVNTACATFDEPFQAGQSDVKDYMLGRRSVGLAIIKLINLKPEVFDK
jgi:hypothetical protein